MDSPYAYLVELMVAMGVLVGVGELMARAEQRRAAKKREQDPAPRPEHAAR